MGTRGLFGFYKQGITKTTYNHSDSYPEGLGLDILKELREYTMDELNKTFDRIILIDERNKPTKDQLNEVIEYTDLNVGQTKEDTDTKGVLWYQALRKAQGNLEPWVKKGLKYMIDSQDFIKDSLFCEWAYIINLDSNELEIWIGFQKVPVHSRYYRDNRDLSEPGSEYYPCAMIKKYSLSKLPSDKKFIKDMKIAKVIDNL